MSYRNVEELLTERGIGVGYETIRRRCRKFGQSYANQLKRSFARAGDKWHLDEVLIIIDSEVHWLLRAVDQHSRVLHILAQKQRNRRVAKRFFRHLLAGQGLVPRVLVMDKRRLLTNQHESENIV